MNQVSRRVYSICLIAAFQRLKQYFLWLPWGQMTLISPLELFQAVPSVRHPPMQKALSLTWRLSLTSFSLFSGVYGCIRCVHYYWMQSSSIWGYFITSALIWLQDSLYADVVPAQPAVKNQCNILGVSILVPVVIATFGFSIVMGVVGCAAYCWFMWYSLQKGEEKAAKSDDERDLEGGKIHVLSVSH